jgi:peptide/nickel transport system permease protein
MAFLLRRLLHSFFLLVGVSILSFAFLQLAPGSFFDEMRLNPQISRETVSKLYVQYGMDRPLPVRYGSWLKSVAKGDWGVSFAYNSPVAPLVLARSRNTLLLTSTATLLAWIIALPLGVLAAEASRRRPWFDHTVTLVTTLLLATPDLLLALAVLWIALRTHWFHAGGILSPGSDGQVRNHIGDLARHLIAPLVVLVLGSLPVLVRHTRAAMLDALDSPYIRAVQAHGISRVRILFRHALPAAAVPLISLFGLSLGVLLSGSLLIEVVMSWPGLGPLLLEAILGRDVYVVIGAVMFSAMFLLVGALLGDLMLFVVDPRIRTEGLA